MVGGSTVSVVPSDIDALICSYPWPCGEARAVAGCEGYPNLVNGDHVGPFQVAVSVHIERIRVTAGLPAASYDEAWQAMLASPALSISVAYQLYADYGSWHHWRFSRKCHGY